MSSALDRVREPLIPARPASARLPPRAWTPNGTNARPGTSQSASRRPLGSSDGAHPWDVPPGSLPPYYEHLAPSRWKDAKLDQSQRDAQARRLHDDATRRQARARAADAATLPPTRWSGRKSASELDAAYRRLADDAAAHVAKRAEVASPDPPQTGIMRYTGSHDEFEGRLEPAPKLPETTRVAGLVKQYYAERATRLVNKQRRFEHYASLAKLPLSDKEKTLLGFDDVPVVPDASDMRAKAEGELAAVKELKRSARARIADERRKMRDEAARYADARERSESARTEAMRTKLAEMERRAKAYDEEVRRRRVEAERAERRKRRVAERAAARERREMIAKFEALATSRRRETAEGDARRRALEAERQVQKRKEMKELYLKQKAREAKYAEMMSSENDAGSVLVMEVRRHTRRVDAERRDAAAKKEEAKRAERMARMESERAYAERVREIEARQTEKIRARLAELHERRVAAEADAERRDAARKKKARAERRAASAAPGTAKKTVKRKKKRPTTAAETKEKETER